jgi:hypothetical protein
VPSLHSYIAMEQPTYRDMLNYCKHTVHILLDRTIQINPLKNITLLTQIHHSLSPTITTLSNTNMTILQHQPNLQLNSVFANQNLFV